MVLCVGIGIWETSPAASARSLALLTDPPPPWGRFCCGHGGWSIGATVNELLKNYFFAWPASPPSGN
jgi:hypothetical protein